MPQEKSIGFEIRSLYNSIRRDIEKNVKDSVEGPDSGVHGWAINFFHENKDKDIFQKDFEEKFQIRRSTASNILKLMERNGYIKRVSVQSDARLKKIVLTEKAVNVHNFISSDIEKREKRMREGITEEELKLFFEITAKMKKNLDN